MIVQYETLYFHTKLQNMVTISAEEIGSNVYHFHRVCDAKVFRRITI